MKNNVLDVDIILQQGRNKRTTANDVTTGSLRLATECFLNAPKTFQEEVCRRAAVGGRVDILKCAFALGVKMESAFEYQFTDDLIPQIVANGHLDVIEILHDQGMDLDHIEMVERMGERGKGKSLHWMMNKGIISDFRFENEVVNYLVRDGELDILKESYKDFDFGNEYDFGACARGGNVEVMNWLLQQYECKWTKYIFFKAASSGSIPMMELCFQHECPTSEYACQCAMENENKDVALAALKWLREHNIPWDEKVCEEAATHGNLKALKWARENGCPWDEETFHCAAQKGNMDILRYCIEHDCPVDPYIVYTCQFFDDYDPSTTLSDLKERSLKVYKLLHEHSILDLEDDGISKILAHENHLETLMWATEQGYPWHEDIFKNAISHHEFRLVEYCLQHLAPKDGTIYADAMIKMHDMDDDDAKIIRMLQMFRDYGIPWNRDVISCDIISCADRLGRSNIVSWLRCVGCPQ
ncbi:hypothetical protein CTEN210_01194 [Chaetoceros tenuissimus]|uniref:Uncharacterized protein n=1 Tax=Chaetoceros tenuissimus TaxID=426638 RepID=A0AAD3GZF5_9STRA|nr:hypothetical protein CTEN210_01194 [Chaetoceros tenuissimus]